MTELDLDRIESAAKAAYERMPYREGTGWRWSGNVDGSHPRIYLSAWVERSGRCIVMGFDRWGMQSAGPCFPSERGMLTDARDRVTFEVGPRSVVGLCVAKADPEVYRYDVAGIDQPIARHIATADPETVLALVQRVRAAEADGLRAKVARIEEVE